MAAAEPRAAIASRAHALGFDAVGFCAARLAPEAAANLRAFIAEGHHGTMDWLEKRTEHRAQPTALWPQARSVIVLGQSYAPEGDALAGLARPERGNIAAYARGRDYHDVIKGKLKTLGQFIVSRFRAEVKVFVDTAPVMEKPLAMQSGIGWQGKNTVLISRRHGTWLFLGEIYTTLELELDVPHPDHCGTCTRCIDICPTHAFLGPYQLDATRCIAYLTIEHHGPIPQELRPLIGNRIFGCDDCLAVCPWNTFAQATREAKLRERPELASPRLADLARLDEAAFRKLFAASPVKRTGRNRFVRNVLVAIGNSGDASLRPCAQELANDPDPVVAEAARWAAERLETA